MDRFHAWSSKDRANPQQQPPPAAPTNAPPPPPPPTFVRPTHAPHAPHPPLRYQYAPSPYDPTKSNPSGPLPHHPHQQHHPHLYAHPLPPPIPPQAPPSAYYAQPYPSQPEYASYRQPPPPPLPPPPSHPDQIKNVMSGRHIGPLPPVRDNSQPPPSANVSRMHPVHSQSMPISSQQPQQQSHQMPQPNHSAAPPIASMPTQSSMRMHPNTQPVGHTGAPTPRTSLPHHPVQGPTHEPVREESQIVGSTSAGAQVVMVTTDRANGMGAGERTANGGFRQLKVEDALLYLEQVKSQFTDHPAVYNQFLDIMKEFKAQSINTAEVIRRVSRLFQGHRGLILGFNTFLPPGYKIELRDDPNTGCITTGFSAPGGGFSALPGASTQPQPGQPLSQQQSQQQAQGMPASVGMMQQHTVQSHSAQPRGAHTAPPYAQHQSHRGSIPHHVQHPHGRMPGPQPDSLHRQPMQGATNPLGQHASQMPLPPVPTARASSTPVDLQDAVRLSQAQRHLPLPVEQKPSIATDGAATLAGGFGAPGGPAPTEAGKPIEFDQAVSYVNKIKSRFSEDEAVYKRFLDILQTYQKEQRTIKQVYEQVSELFRDHRDLLNEFSHFLPEAQSVANAQAQQLAAHSGYMAGSSMKHPEGPDYMPGHSKIGGMPYPMMSGGGQHRGRPIKGEGRFAAPITSKKTTTSSDVGKKIRRSYKKADDGYEQAPSIVSEFFDEVRSQLGESGAAVYKELIKCLSLVSQEIINAEELMKLIEGLLVNHKHLTKAFGMFIDHNYTNAAERALRMLRDTRDPEHASKRPRDEQRLNPMYRDKKLSDVVREYGNSVPGSSYARYPEDLGGVQCSGMTEMDRNVLNFAVGAAKERNRLLDHDSHHGSPEHRIPLTHVLQEGHKLRGARVTDVREGGPRSPTAVLDDGIPAVELTVEEQRVEMDVLIGNCDSTLKKLRQIMDNEKTTDDLTSHDLWPIELIYDDSFKEFEQLLRNSNEQAVKLVHKRLTERRKEWGEARKRMEQVWRTHRFASGHRAKKYTRAEFVEEMRQSELREMKLSAGDECSEIMVELLWYMLEWNLENDELEEAERVVKDYERVRTVIRRTDGWFIVEEHLFTLMRLVCEVSERAQWVVKQGKAKETVDTLKGLLSNEVDIVEYEGNMEKLYGETEWAEKLSDFGVVLKKFVRAAMKMPNRGLAQTMLRKAEKRAERKDSMEVEEEDKKYVEKAIDMAKEKGCGMLFKMVCAGEKDDCTEVVVRQVKEKKVEITKSKFVRYVERMARKRKRMEFEMVKVA